MTGPQKFALDNHCRFAFETGLPEFAHLVRDGSYSLVLSVNSGYE